MSKLGNIFLMLAPAMFTSCQNAPAEASRPMTVALLATQFENSRAVVRSRYDGKEIVIRGSAFASPTMPGGSGQGALILTDKETPHGLTVTCWFANEQAATFAKVRTDQQITVRGVFTGESGADLKFCKVVGIE